MPTIQVIKGVKIEIFSGDHPPPHVHASYSGEEVLITIMDNEIYAGKMNNKKRAVAQEYVSTNKDRLLTIFNELNSHLK